MGRYVTRSDVVHAMRNVARHHGYALTEHGSRARDVDVVAIPWTREARPMDMLVEAITAALDGRQTQCETRPHGRVSIAIIPAGVAPADNWYVDLAVMPLQAYAEAA